MRNRSNKRARIERKLAPIRAAYVARARLCECCGKRQADQCHEIVGGSNRWITFQERCFWLAVCFDCNMFALTDKKEWPLVRQLKLKLLADPEYFDLARVLEVAGFAPTYITIEEVRGCAA